MQSKRISVNQSQVVRRFLLDFLWMLSMGFLIFIAGLKAAGYWRASRDT